MTDYTVEELKQFKDEISMRLCSLKSAQHWTYKADTAEKIIWLEALCEKIEKDIKNKDSNQRKTGKGKQ